MATFYRIMMALASGDLQLWDQEILLTSEKDFTIDTLPNFTNYLLSHKVAGLEGRAAGAD